MNSLKHNNPRVSDAPWALVQLVSRAWVADPVRTERDLRELGFESLARELKIDDQTGRLAENQSALEG